MSFETINTSTQTPSPPSIPLICLLSYTRVEEDISLGSHHLLLLQQQFPHCPPTKPIFKTSILVHRKTEYILYAIPVAHSLPRQQKLAILPIFKLFINNDSAANLLWQEWHQHNWQPCVQLFFHVSTACWAQENRKRWLDARLLQLITTHCNLTSMTKAKDNGLDKSTKPHVID